MGSAVFGHAEDESLELYAMGRLQEPDLGDVEEHLLICEPCRIRLGQCDAYAKAMRSAAASIRRQEKTLPAKGIQEITARGG